MQVPKNAYASMSWPAVISIVRVYPSEYLAISEENFNTSFLLKEDKSQRNLSFHSLGEPISLTVVKLQNLLASNLAVPT